jgi:hypothetical protein
MNPPLLRGILERPRKGQTYAEMPAGLDLGQQYQWERGCHLKRRFASRDEALRCAIAVAVQVGDCGQVPYLCPWCGDCWHLGHSEKQR